MRVRGLLIVLSTLSALACVPGAAALPGDEPAVPLTPSNGAVLAPKAAGVEVTFACPVYRVLSAGTGFTVFGGPSDHGVGFARSPALGSDGRLRRDRLVALDQGHTSSALPPGRCRAAMAEGGSRPFPQETPGTYHWQVWRICTGCAGGWEAGPVQHFVLRAKAKLSLSPQRRAYSGYPIVVPLRLAGVPDRTSVRVERRVGGRWRRIASGAAYRGRGEALVALGRGAQRLRVVATVGDQRFSSAARRVDVRRPKRWSTGSRDDGRYKGTSAGTRSVSFRVAGKGREIRGFSASVATLCPQAGINPFTTLIGKASIGRIYVAPDGRFIGAATPGRTGVLVRGRLANRRVSAGKVELSMRTCSGSVRFTAGRG